MCGRYLLTVSGRLLAEALGLDEVPELRPRYNIAPTQVSTVVRLDEHGRRRCHQLRWGLVPSWADDPRVGARMINARAETAGSKAAFRHACRSRRCLVAADGFYEWQRRPDGKIPHVIRFRDRRAFALAGLWERWEAPGGGDPLETFTILTTEPNALVEPLHSRMPVILRPQHVALWLEPGGLRREQVRQLTVPYDPADMEAVPVSSRVNSTVNDDAACLGAAL